MQLSAIKMPAYTLLELAIVISVIGVMLASGIEVTGSYFEARRIQITEERMQMIDEALIRFARRNEYLPCPADGRVAVTDPNFGAAVTYNETPDPGSCGDPQGAVYGAFPQYATEPRGVPPVKTLGLSNDVMFDGWGRKFSYHLSDGLGHDPDLTPTPAPNDFLEIGNQGNLEIVDVAGRFLVLQGAAQPQIDKEYGAAYVLLSHGENGQHAWTRAGTKITSGSPSAEEDDNAESTTAPATQTRYVQDKLSDSFDDILIFRHKWQVEVPRKRIRPVTLPEDLRTNFAGLASLITAVTNGTAHTFSYIGTPDTSAATAPYTLTDEEAVQAGLTGLAELYATGVNPTTPKCPRNLTWQTDTDANERYDNGPAEGACVCAGGDASGAGAGTVNAPTQNFNLAVDRFGGCTD